MKLNYRDKVILIVVIILAILGAGIFLLIVPKYKDVELAKQILATKEQEKDDIDMQIAAIPDMKKRLEEIHKDGVEISEHFYPHKQTFEIDREVYQILKDCKISWTSFSVSEMTPANVNFYQYSKPVFTYPLYIASDLVGELPESVKTGAPDVRVDPQPQIVATSQVSIVFTAAKNDLKALLDKVYGMDKTIIITSVTVGNYDLSAEGADNEVTGSLTFQLLFLNELSELPD